MKTALVLLVGLTILRVLVLLAALVDLGPDEAQYWSWAQHLSFGYFSKPPMIAWLIAGTTSLCGDGEACVRISAPLLHGATAFLVFLLARRLYGDRTALWAAIGFATLPAVWLSAGLITTDVPLVFFWALALLAYDRLIAAHGAGDRKNALKWAALCGAAIGLGLLSKYAMIYFLLCTGVHIAVSQTARRALVSPAGALVLFVAIAAVSPNIVWNAHEHFATLRHTAANANWQGHLFNPAKLAEFFAAQFFVFGPILMIMYLWGLVTLRKRMADGPPGADLLLFAFSAPILVVALGQAFVSRANANWAGPAFIAATILVSAWLVRSRDKIWLQVWRLRLPMGMWLRVSLGIHLVSGIVTYSLITVPGAIELFAVENAFKRLRGWDTLAVEIERLTKAEPYRAVMTDHRMVTAEILYYGRKLALPVVVFDSDSQPGNEYELRAPYRAEIGGPVLYLTFYEDKAPVLSHFSQAAPIETFRMRRGRDLFLDFAVYRLDGYKG
jgi:4-amino-4-deoxy-L-arabinose transferase-like glycosyltransferase